MGLADCYGALGLLWRSRVVMALSGCYGALGLLWRSRGVMARLGCYAWWKFYAVLLCTLGIICGTAGMYALNWWVLLYGRIYCTSISSAYGLCYLARRSGTCSGQSLSGGYGALGLLWRTRAMCGKNFMPCCLYMMYNTWYHRNVGIQLVGVAVRLWLPYEHISCLWLMLSVT